jgi:ribosomal protein S18 acetylase RimI-like enzyme
VGGVRHNDLVQIRRLTSTAELFALAGGDHLVRSELAPGDTTVGWAADDGGLAFSGPSDDRTRSWLTVLGRPGAGAEALVRHALAELPTPPLGLSAPRGTDLDWLELADRELWDFMVFDEASGPLRAQPGEERVVGMAPGPETDAEMAGFLKLANPTHSAKPGWDAIRRWASVRDDDGALLAVGAYCVRNGGNGYLASIGTLPAARGQGLGLAVIAWLTQQSLNDGNPFCSLGHYSPNEPARRLYLRVGYRTTHEMAGGIFPWLGDGRDDHSDNHGADHGIDDPRDDAAGDRSDGRNDAGATS